jgi:dTDP-glucose 4,6-dehydratase
VEQTLDRKIDAIVNFAAESHVDRSIEDPSGFLRTNILGTQTLLEAARVWSVPRFVQISTDEVYGSLGPQGHFRENSPLAPNSPYSASKAAADLLVRSYWKTYGYPGIITRSSNNYGPYQFPEKLIPLFITNAVAYEPLPVYGDGLYVRDWIYVKDHCRAIDLVLHKGEGGEVYNIGASEERTNLEITHYILKKLSRDPGLIRRVQDRPGHDRRYAINSEKVRKALGWEPEYSFEEGMNQTIQWYVEHESWWKAIKSGEYLNYYQRIYGTRLGSPMSNSV